MSDIEPICRKCGKSIPDGSWAGVKMARRGFEYEHLQCPSPCPNCEAAARQLAELEREIGRAAIAAGVIFNATNPEIDGMIARWRKLHAEGVPE